MKYLILVGDGMGDYPLDELGGKTPLEAAKTPAMDELCAQGELFLTKTVPEGFPPGSDVANLSLIGYDPDRYYTGRAPLEAASMGISLAPDETAFRCNLVTLDRSLPEQITMVDFTAGHISSEEAAELIEVLEARCGGGIFRFYPGVSYRHLLILRGFLPGFKTVPPHDYIDQNISSYHQAYFQESTWAAMLTEAEAILAEHPVNRRRLDAGLLPANGIWPWGEGTTPTMPSLFERFGIIGSMISAVDLLKGIGTFAGLDIINVPGATGFIDTNYEGKAQAALDALKSQDFVFVHLEAPDESGHQGSIDNKIQAIEDFDQKIVDGITKELLSKNVDFRAVITMDHFTPISLRTHTSDLVPTILYDSRRYKTGTGLPFSERATSENDTEILANGHRLINKLLEQAEV
ncbi:MAG: cofactor-independent phosphoglycerate mutase [Desulfocapsaceae bacterium]|nr:cofactor-independent phosphoglycerate mutase [Desulfocapsaceae bacterium]